MSLSGALGKGLSAPAITAYVVLTLTFGVSHSDSRANTFPNPEVPYQIPSDESPKEQALYLYEVLK